MWQWLRKTLYPSYYVRSNSRTVRYTFPFAFFTLILVGAAATISSQRSYISITTDASFEEGNEVTVSVHAYAHVPVNAVNVVLAYPKDQLTYSGIDIGESVITLWTEDPYERDGKIHLSGGVFQQGFIGEHLIGKVRFKPKTSGIAYITLDSVDLVAGDGRGTPVETETTSNNSVRLYLDDSDGELVARGEILIVTDIDGSGGVDLSDISTFMAAWFSRRQTFDFNGDGKMTFRDFSILLFDSFIK